MGHNCKKKKKKKKKRPLIKLNKLQIQLYINHSKLGIKGMYLTVLHMILNFALVFSSQARFKSFKNYTET